jgi:hypothetical protein
VNGGLRRSLEKHSTEITCSHCCALHFQRGTKLEKEYRHLGTTLDLWLKWSGFISIEEICFELKVKLSRKTDYDRLVGQIEGIDPRKNQVIVVLIGDTDPALLERLRERYRELMETDLNRRMAIVCVPIPA